MEIKYTGHDLGTYENGSLVNMEMPDIELMTEVKSRVAHSR